MKEMTINKMMDYFNNVVKEGVMYRNETLDVPSLLDYIINFNENSRNLEECFFEEIAA